MSSSSIKDTPDAPIILIVEDDPEVKMQLEMYLHAEQFACVAVENIEEGWSALQ
jgi:DNA-binding response OmpR family regulator